MSLVFGALVPHPPMLLPSIGKDAFETLSETARALRRIEEELYAAKPQVIVVLSPHTSLFGEAFVVNAHPKVFSNFAEFGDLTTVRTWNVATDLAARLSHAAKKQKIPLQLTSLEQVDHGVSVPLFYLSEHLPDVQILPIGFSAASTDDHLAFGRFLKELFIVDNKRIAVVASVDLSHRVSEKSRHGFHADGKRFDEAVRLAFKENTVDPLLALEPDALEHASSCGFRSLLLFHGIFDHADTTAHELCYEHPFGIGYLTGYFSLL